MSGRHPMSERVRFPALARSLILAALVAISAADARAARPDVEVPERELLPDVLPLKAGDLVLRAQKALTQLGLYIGAEDGRLTHDTEAAVRAFQRRNGIKVDGLITRSLVEMLENSLQIRVLLTRLDKVRIENISAARQALLGHPATRDLVSGDRDSVADPTRDRDKCFANVTVRCLIAEAMESAKAVFKAELRDWALGEILVAQARAGLREEAMMTASLMRDPRLIMVALRDIAEAQAAAGMSTQALSAVEIIPNQEKQAEALAAIAAIQARRGDQADARATAERLLGSIGGLEKPLVRLGFQTRAATVLAGAGAADRAREILVEAEAFARTQRDSTQRSVALRHVANALAETRQLAQALALLDDVANNADRTSVLITAARRQAQAGDAAAALATADTIDAVRYRAVVLGQIALSQAATGSIADAEVTLDIARAAIQKIKLPFARSYAISRVSMAIAGIGRLPAAAAKAPAMFKAAAEAANEIDDTRLRAHTLWSIAAEQRRAGDRDGARATEAMADKATTQVKSALSRVWMFAEIASAHAGRGEAEAALAAFEKGLAEGRAIDNAWGRARAFGKLAATLIEVANPGKGIAEEDKPW